MTSPLPPFRKNLRVRLPCLKDERINMQNMFQHKDNIRFIKATHVVQSCNALVYNCLYSTRAFNICDTLSFWEVTRRRLHLSFKRLCQANCNLYGPYGSVWISRAKVYLYIYIYIDGISGASDAKSSGGKYNIP